MNSPKKEFQVSYLEAMLKVLQEKRAKVEEFYDANANFFLLQGATKERLLRTPINVERDLQEAIAGARQAHVNLVVTKVVDSEEAVYDFDEFIMGAHKILDKILEINPPKIGEETPPESLENVQIFRLQEGVHIIHVIGRNPGPNLGMSKELHLIPSLNEFIEEGNLPPEAVEGIRQAKVGDLAIAESLLWEAMNQNPNDLVTQQNYIIVLMKQGRLNEAETELRKILSSQPRNGRIHLLLGHVLHELGRKEEARKQYMLGISDSQTIDVYGAINLNLYEDEPFKNNMIAFTDEERR